MLTFNVDISAPSGPLVIYAMQADSMSRFFALTIMDGGAAWTPPTGAIWTVRFGAPQMPSGWYDTITEPGGSTHAAVVVNENTATVEIAEQAISTPGQNVLCVLVTDAQGYQIASWPFVLSIQAVPGLEAPEATVYYNALTEQVAQVLSNATAAAASATLAQSWAVGGTGSREGEDTDNAKYYAQIAQQVAQEGVGYYETPEALRTAHPTGQAGNWAIVGSTDTIWVWDTDTGDWVDSHGNIDLSNYYTKTEADARFSAISSGVPTVSATKEQNYFDIDLPSTNQFVIVPNAAYATGDTFRIAGRAVAAMLPNGDSLPDAFFAANAKVMCLWADTVLYFVGGGGTVPNNVMRYRMDDGTPGQQPEQTIWGQTSDGQDAYVHSCTKAVYNPETGKTLDEEMVTMQDSPAAITGETSIKPVCDASGNVICPQTRTAAVYDPVSGQTLDAVLGEEKLKLLWTNPAPLENFGKQTVALDLSKYDLVLISFMNGTSANFVNNGIFFIGDTIQVVNGFTNSQKRHRNLLVSSTGVRFEESYKYVSYGQDAPNTIDYSAMRPLYIYGIKL